MDARENFLTLREALLRVGVILCLRLKYVCGVLSVDDSSFSELTKLDDLDFFDLAVVLRFALLFVFFFFSDLLFDFFANLDLSLTLRTLKALLEELLEPISRLTVLSELKSKLTVVSELKSKLTVVSLDDSSKSKYKNNNQQYPKQNNYYTTKNFNFKQIQQSYNKYKKHRL